MYNLIKNAELFVSDMDGTVYLGDNTIQGATEFVHSLRKNNKQLLFFTNNASRTKRYYEDKLLRLGFGECEVMTAGDVTINYLQKNYKNKTVYVLGTKQLKNEMSNASINIVENENAEIVVTSFDTELTYNRLTIACNALRNGAIYLCTHPDFNCPVENGGFIPDSGSIAAMVTASTGKVPKYLGKPYAETAKAIIETKCISAEKIVCIGDRLYTDIALAKNSGMVSVLVLSGETSIQDVKNDIKPDYIINSVNDILNFF